MEKRITCCSLQVVPCHCTWWLMAALAAGTRAIALTTQKQIKGKGGQSQKPTRKNCVPGPEGHRQKEM